MNNDDMNRNTAPTTLTDEQTALVSGGALGSLVLQAGCPTCSSGRQLAFQALANIVNPAMPAQSFQAYG
jgi:hypothetical protein